MNAGDLVGVIQQKDPMGSRDRWFVDNGLTQGFVPSRVLGAIGENNHEETSTEAAASSSTSAPVRHAYDDVAPDEEEGAPGEVRQPVRKAPPVPKPAEAEQPASTDEPTASEAQAHQKGKPSVEPIEEEEEEPAPKEAGKSHVPGERNNYEEITAASEVSTEVKHS